MLFTTNSLFFEHLFSKIEIDIAKKQTQFIGICFALSTLFILIFYQAKYKIFHYLVRILFASADGVIIWTFFDISIIDYIHNIAIAYGAYTLLILVFVGEIGFKYFKNRGLLKDFENTENEKTSQDFGKYSHFIKSGIEKELSTIRMKLKKNTSEKITIPDYILEGCKEYGIELSEEETNLFSKDVL